MTTIAMPGTPPARYDHPYPGKMILRRIHPIDVPAACRALFERAELPEHKKRVVPTQRGCAVRFYATKVCEVITIDRTAYNTLPEAVIRHERGHCNGWRWNHPE
jgi:hypothetical protein